MSVKSVDIKIFQSLRQKKRSKRDVPDQHRKLSATDSHWRRNISCLQCSDPGHINRTAGQALCSGVVGQSAQNRLCVTVVLSKRNNIS